MLDIGNKIKLDQMKVLITSECNLNCTHCFRSFDKHKFFIPDKKLIEIVDYALETQCESISFSGGEFFMHPFAYGLLEYCYKNNLKVKILTNATKLEKFDFFEKYKGTDLLSFQISLDGMKENHDLRRGNGIFDLVMSNVKRLKDYGFHLTVSMTIDQSNMYDVVDVMEIPYFDKHNFLPVAFAGEKTKEGRPIIDDDYLEYENILRLIYNSRESNGGEEERCRMFPYQLGIRYDGNVYPCAVARDYDAFCLGNLIQKPISEIVNDYLSSSDSLELMNYINNKISECDNCLSKEKCNRGCRIRAYKFYGKFNAPDPFCCKLYENKYPEIPINCIFWGEE